MVFTLRCDVPCTVSGRAELRGGTGPLSFSFRTSIASPAAERRVRVRIGPRARARLVRWFYDGEHVEQQVTATVTDASGNRGSNGADREVEPPVSVDRPRAPRCERARGRTVFRQGDVRIYTYGTGVAESRLDFWWACRDGQTRRYLVAGGYPGTYFRSAILRADRLLLVDVGFLSTMGNESSLALYDLRAVRRRYHVDFGFGEVVTMHLGTNATAAASVREGPNFAIWGISPSGRATQLAFFGPTDTTRVGSLRLENDTVFWTENDVEQSAPIPD